MMLRFFRFLKDFILTFWRFMITVIRMIILIILTLFYSVTIWIKKKRAYLRFKRELQVFQLNKKGVIGK